MDTGGPVAEFRPMKTFVISVRPLLARLASLKGVPAEALP
jgi:hypothetical protein